MPLDSRVPSGLTHFFSQALLRSRGVPGIDNSTYRLSSQSSQGIRRKVLITKPYHTYFSSLIRSKVRISPAFAPMGPRFSLPHQVGAYIGGGGLQHERHVINVSESLAR